MAATALHTSKEVPSEYLAMCLFLGCRSHGQVIRASLREELEQFVELRPICPELEIGLGVPRDPVRLVSHGDGATRLNWEACSMCAGPR